MGSLIYIIQHAGRPDRPGMSMNEAPTSRRLPQSKEGGVDPPSVATLHPNRSETHIPRFPEMNARINFCDPFMTNVIVGTESQKVFTQTLR